VWGAVDVDDEKQISFRAQAQVIHIAVGETWQIPWLGWWRFARYYFEVAFTTERLASQLFSVSSMFGNDSLRTREGKNNGKKGWRNNEPSYYQVIDTLGS